MITNPFLFCIAGILTGVLLHAYPPCLPGALGGLALVLGLCLPALAPAHRRGAFLFLLSALCTLFLFPPPAPTPAPTPMQILLRGP